MRPSFGAKRPSPLSYFMFLIRQCLSLMSDKIVMRYKIIPYPVIKHRRYIIAVLESAIAHRTVTCQIRSHRLSLGFMSKRYDIDSII